MALALDLDIMRYFSQLKLRSTFLYFAILLVFILKLMSQVKAVDCFPDYDNFPKVIGGV